MDLRRETEEELVGKEGQSDVDSVLIYKVVKNEITSMLKNKVCTVHHLTPSLRNMK